MRDYLAYFLTGFPGIIARNPGPDPLCCLFLGMWP